MVNSNTLSVRVVAPARLHLGFLDPSATLGRRFGSIGLAVEGLSTVLEAERHDTLECAGLECERAHALAQRVVRHYGLPAAARLRVESAIPGHAGLGSGTQLALAVGHALTRLHGVAADTAEIGAVLGRGRRSGIGLSLFDRGGLIVDAGHGAATRTPPLVSRMDFPDWPLLLIFDRAAEGLSGGAESAAFAALEPLPQTAAAHLCHLTLMRLLPALAEGDFAPFAASLGEIQAVVGDHFAGVQDGRFTSPRVAAVIDLLTRRHGLEGCGQSSWGPTAFAVLPDADTARQVLDSLHEAFPADTAIEFRIVSARNRGACVETTTAVPARRRAGG
ncbi:MAG: beta-ribofuranosylaminobenzene 5'-phosphate synthase family protein [Gammaproteobacteria bacterium]